MSRNLPCGVEFMRGILLLLNIFFFLVGIALIVIGIYIAVDNNFSAVLNRLSHVSTFEVQALGFLAFAMIGGGIFTVLIALFGCIGTLKHNRCLLYTYAIVLSILMIIELVAIIMAFSYKSRLQKVYKENLGKIFVTALNTNDSKVLRVFHDLEKSMKCCGVNGIEDYNTNSSTEPPPPSCVQHPEPCSDAIIKSLDKDLPVIGGTLGFVLFLELLSLISAIVLLRALKRSPDTPRSSNPTEVLSNLVPNRRRNYSKV